MKPIWRGTGHTSEIQWYEPIQHDKCALGSATLYILILPAHNTLITNITQWLTFILMRLLYRLSLTVSCLPTPTPAWVGCSSPSVCLVICPRHNSKKKDHKVIKVGVRMTLGYPRSNMILELKGQRSRLHGQQVHFSHSIRSITQKRMNQKYSNLVKRMTLGCSIEMTWFWGFKVIYRVKATAMQRGFRGFELCECLLLLIVVGAYTVFCVVTFCTQFFSSCLFGA